MKLPEGGIVAFALVKEWRWEEQRILSQKASSPAAVAWLSLGADLSALVSSVTTVTGPALV